MSQPTHPWADFRNFVFTLWGLLNLPSPTDVQFDITLYLQRGPRRRMVKAFRGVGKSWLTAAYVVWLLWKNPDHKVMVVSASKERADAFSIFVKRIIEMMPELAHLRPRAGQRSSNLAFDVGPARPDQAPSVKSVGITGQLVGSRADTIVADDVESPRNSMTVEQRDKLSEAVKEFDAVIKPGGEIIYLGTDQTEQGLYSKLPERGYEVRVWPVQVPDKPEKYAGTLAPFITAMIDAGKPAGTPVEPTRFSLEDLAEREASYGRSGYAMQFMLDPSLSDANRYPLKLGDLIVMDVDREVAPIRVVWSSGPEYVRQDIPSVGFTGDRLYRPMYVSDDMEEYTGAVMTVDPSGRGADELSYAVTKFLRGLIYCRRAGGLSGTGYSQENLETLAHIARTEKVKLILVESNFGGGMFAQMLSVVLQRIYPCTVEEITSTGQKERRIIDTLEPVMNQHRLVMDATILRADQSSETPYQLFHQLTRITKARGSLRHDDRLDALAMSVAYWSEQMARNVDNEEEKRMEELFDEELRKFEESVLGYSRPPPNFYDVI